ncbi:MAG TPA: hypothetical protein VGH03_14735 [Caulobacteraceae bacterium]|jgi:hypothetical protein
MLASLPPAHATPAPVVRYGFNKSQLGETLTVWRSSAPAGVTCSAAGAVTTCTAPLVPLGGGYVARNLTYRFVNGELARINFHTSIDAFSWVRSRIDTRFGDPARVVRNNIAADSVDFPHVRDVWRNGRSTIMVDDPSPDMSTLRVTYTLDSLASALPAAS